VVYIDAYFLLNFWMDVAGLWCVAMWGNRRRKAVRILAAAGVGAVLACLLLVLAAVWGMEDIWLSGEGNLTFGGMVWMGLVLFGCNPLMVWIAFGWGNIWEFGTRIVLLYVAVFLLGGIWGWIAQTAVGSVLPVEGYAVVCAFAAWTGAYVVIVVREKKKRYYPVILVKNGVRREVTALYDSGNLLYDPRTHEAVCLLAGEAYEKIWGDMKKEEKGINTFAEERKKPQKEEAFVSVRTAGGGRSVMRLVRFEQMEILGKEAKVIKNPLLALSPADGFADGKAQMLLHGDFFL
jgi:sigma-E processing peptidase SpoIIGA